MKNVVSLEQIIEKLHYTQYNKERDYTQTNVLLQNIFGKSILLLLDLPTVVATQ